MTPKDKYEAEFGDTFSRTFIAWQQVEFSLFFLYSTLWKRADPALVRLSYYAVRGLEIRVSIIDAVLRRQLDAHQDLLDRWAKLMKKVNHKARRRNELAHFVLENKGTDASPEYELRPSNILARGGGAYDLKQIREFGVSFSRLGGALYKYTRDVADRLL